MLIKSNKMARYIEGGQRFINQPSRSQKGGYRLVEAPKYRKYTVQPPARVVTYIDPTETEKKAIQAQINYEKEAQSRIKRAMNKASGEKANILGERLRASQIRVGILEEYGSGEYASEDVIRLAADVGYYEYMRSQHQKPRKAEPIKKETRGTEPVLSPVKIDLSKTSKTPPSYKELQQQAKAAGLPLVTTKSGFLRIPETKEERARKYAEQDIRIKAKVGEQLKRGGLATYEFEGINKLVGTPSALKTFFKTTGEETKREWIKTLPKEIDLWESWGPNYIEEKKTKRKKDFFDYALDPYNSNSTGGTWSKKKSKGMKIDLGISLPKIKL